MNKIENNVDLTTINYAELDKYSASDLLLDEAKKRGFYRGRTEYNQMFSKLFFSGGTVTFKSGLNEEFESTAWAYCCGFMASFDPKHEVKEAICAMLMSELLDSVK